jgi:hypothetical protein
MSKKDYKLMAGSFAQVRTKENETALKFLVSTFCTIAKADNPNFDKEKFELACGL